MSLYSTHQQMLLVSLFLFLVCTSHAFPSFTPSQDHTAHNEEDAAVTMGALEQPYLEASQQYKAWRTRMQSRPHSSSSSSASGSAVDGSVDLELLARLQEEEMEGPPSTEYRYWRRQQRAEALRAPPSARTYQFVEAAKQTDVVPLGWQHPHHHATATARHPQQHLPLPSTTQEGEPQYATPSPLSLALGFVKGPEGDSETQPPLPSTVKGLKQFLRDRGVVCDGCLEVEDLATKAHDVRRMPTVDDLAVSQMTAAWPQQSTTETAFADNMVAMISELQVTNPQAAEVVRQTLQQRSLLKMNSNCNGANVNWLAGFNTTIPPGCTLSLSQAVA